MIIGQEALVGLVPKVNAALALASWPYVLYEGFTKHPHISDQCERLALRRSQILGEVSFDIAERIGPFLPRTTTRIIIEATAEDDVSPRLSDDAIGEIKTCLESHERAISIAVGIPGLTSRMLRTDTMRFCFIFAAGLESVAALIVWGLIPAISGWLARVLIGLPIFTILVGFVCAGILRIFTHTARRTTNLSGKE